MTQFIFKLEEAMLNNDFSIHGHININSTKFQRFKSSRAMRKGKDIFVKILGNFDGAVFGDWHNRQGWVTWWEKDFKDLSREEKSRRINIIDKFKEEEQYERNYAINRCKELLAHRICHEALETHPYILKKKIKPLYARQIRSKIILPIYNIHGLLQSLQFIYPNGFKRFKKNASPRGGFHLLGERILQTDVIRICEGWATGCSIYEAVGGPVIVAYAASNLVEVASAFRNKYPLNKICICADNDAHLKTNIGLMSAQEAAKKTGSFLRYPDFSIIGTAGKPTDFNDLMIVGGIEEVQKQLM